MLRTCHPAGRAGAGEEVAAGDVGVGAVDRGDLGAEGVVAGMGDPGGRTDGTDEAGTVACRATLMAAPQAATPISHVRLTIAVRTPRLRLTGQRLESAKLYAARAAPSGRSAHETRPW